MSRHNLAWLLGIVSVTLFGLAIAFGVPNARKDQDYERMRLTAEVLDLLQTRYVKKLSGEQIRKFMEVAFNNGLESLDPHSAYLPPEEHAQFNRQSEGAFGGVGIHIGYDASPRNRLIVARLPFDIELPILIVGDASTPSQLVVVSPMVDTPAYNAGIMAGDAILKIDGKSTDGMRLTDAVALIQGEPGTKVTLTVRSEDGKTRDVPLERARIQVRSVLGDRRKGDGKSWDFMWDHQEKIGYLRLTGFGKNTVSEMKEALEELRKQGMRGLVLDLRSNPGGLLKSAKEVSNLFLEKGLIVSIKGDNQDEEAYYADRHEAVLGKDSGVPMAVLINRYSASASEIVAACLQDHHRAIVVGERSYGKGSVQNVIPLTRGQGALKLTTAYYWRPSGKMVHREKDARDSDDWGVIPDIVVNLSREERMAYNRARNERDILRDHKDPKKVPPFEDKVLNRAVEVLKEKLRKKE